MKTAPCLDRLGGARAQPFATSFLLNFSFQDRKSKAGGRQIGLALKWVQTARLPRAVFRPFPWRRQQDNRSGAGCSAAEQADRERMPALVEYTAPAVFTAAPGSQGEIRGPPRPLPAAAGAPRALELLAGAALLLFAFSLVLALFRSAVCLRSLPSSTDQFASAPRTGSLGFPSCPAIKVLKCEISRTVRISFRGSFPTFICLFVRNVSSPWDGMFHNDSEAFIFSHDL